MSRFGVKGVALSDGIGSGSSATKSNGIARAWRIALPRTIRLGPGAVSELGEVATGLGVTRPLVVADRFLSRTGVTHKIMERLEAEGLAPALFSDIVPDPTTDSVDRALAVLREHGCDAVIGFGGGSSLDTAKAVALRAVAGHEIREYKAPRINVGPALPIIAVPTTAGTGSEATQVAVITDSVSDEKMMCMGPALLPVAAVIDHELTVSMPPRLTADTGIDSLTHAIEAYVSRKSNPFSDCMALTAMNTIGTYLRRAYTNGNDLEARSAMMLAATQAGIAFSNSSVALVHGMSRPIGAHFHVPHGMSNAMLFPAVTAFSIGAAESRYADCARALGVAADHDDDTVASVKLVSELAQLCSDVEVPTPAAYGVDSARWSERTPLMAEQAIASGSPSNNPRVPTIEEICALYESVYD